MSVSGYQHGMSDEGDNMAARRRSSVIAAPPLTNSRGSTVLAQPDEALRKMSMAVLNLPDIIEEGKNAAEVEKKMGFREGSRLYPKAILFSFDLSLAVIMKGYDTALIGNFYAMPQFSKKYGGLAKDGTYQVAPSWQSALSNGGQVGSIIGLFLNGIISERIGYRKTMIISLALILCFIFINFFAVTAQMLLAGYVLCGSHGAPSKASPLPTPPR